MKLYNGKAVTAVILCAGSGTRTSLGYNKILHILGSKTVFELCLDAFTDSCVNNIVAVINKTDETELRELASAYYRSFESFVFAYGGSERSGSVLSGLLAASGCDIAVIHDCARPFVTPTLINATVDSAIAHGSGIAAVKTTDTIKRVRDGKIAAGVPRADLYNAQTPQSFDYELILNAYKQADGNYTDDSEVYSAAGYSPYIVEGDYGNVKITTPADLLKTTPTGAKTGVGFDVHQLVVGRPLILGGIEIPHSKGLLGHSDADVLTHAIMDALLSAADLPDIGVLFPDSDPATDGVSSMKLLSTVLTKIREKRKKIINVSAVIMAQKPKLSGYVADIRANLAKAMNIKTEQINVSATTTEHLGIIGEEKGIAASAVCLLAER